MISRKTIEKIFESSDVYEVISEKVELKKAGVNYKGKCPFHDEKTASFVVSKEKQIFKCFGCGASGNSSVSFLMQYDKLDYTEALRNIAKRYNITIEYDNLSSAQKKAIEEQNKLKDRLSNINEFALKFFIYNIQNNKDAIRYARSRFSEEEISTFQIGYAPNGFDTFYKYARDNGYIEEHLLKSTLVKLSKNNKCYDFFNDRLIFPIYDHYGRVIAFAGRLMSKKEAPKYINTENNAIYDKSKTLYGLFQARKSIQQLDFVNIVEGYTDVTSMHSNGFLNTVSTCGTALTIEHTKLLKKYTNNFNIIFDGDNAGLKSSIRSGEIPLREKCNVYISSINDMDPDNILKS